MRLFHPSLMLGSLAVFLTPSPVRPENRLWFPDREVASGARAEKFFLHCSHDFPLAGFSISVRYQPADLLITEVTTAGTSLVELPEPVGFWNGKNNRVKGEIAYGAVFDFTDPLTSNLAPSPDRTVVRLSADVLAAPGASTPLELVDGLGDASPINNILVDPSAARSTHPVLRSGTVTVESPALFAEAGPDQFVPESSVIALDGSASRSAEDRPLTFSWQQLAGPPAQLLAEPGDSRPRYAIPALTAGDVSLVFELMVDDGLSSSTDVTTVTAVDRDLRRGLVARASGGGPRLIDGGARAIVFDGELSWGTNLEDCLWSAARFTASGEGDESSLLSGAALYLDLNDSGTLDSPDVQIGSRQTLASDNGQLEFRFSELVLPVAPRRFFLVVDIARAPSARAIFLFPCLLLPAALATLGRTRRRPGWSVPAGRILLAALCALSIHAAACSSGSGGGSEAPAPAAPSRQVRFDLTQTSDVELAGRTSGVAALIDGLPLQGEALELPPGS